MNRRQFTRRALFGLFGGAAAVGSAQAAAPKDRFTRKTKFGTYDFVWTGWKQQLGVGIVCGQWFAEPADRDKAPKCGSDEAPYDYARPAFYSSTTGTEGPLRSMNYVFDLAYQKGHPLITDLSSTEQKAESRQEALDRLMKFIEAWEVPELKYYVNSNSHISDRSGLRPGEIRKWREEWNMTPGRLEWREK